MYLHMCIYIYVNIYMHIYVYICKYIYMHVCMHVCPCTLMNTKVAGTSTKTTSANGCSSPKNIVLWDAIWPPPPPKNQLLL